MTPPPLGFFAALGAGGACPLSAALSSRRVISPEPSPSKARKASSMSSLGASKPSAAMALRNSFFDTVPLPSSSHSRKRSMTRTAFAESSSCSCSETL